MIPVSEPDLSGRERDYLLDAFDSGWISSRGAYVERAEEALVGLTGSPFSAVCSNGTTALHLALLAAGVAAGDEVILPSLTYISTLNAVYFVGAEPVIVDVLETTWCIDPAAVEASITPRTKAILAVDVYGHTADYPALRRVADRHGLIVIADAAESIGATLNGVPAGALADVTTFSFFANKVITSGEGGAVTTNSPKIDAAIRQLRNQGNNPDTRYLHDVLGFNYRMTNLAAAILTAQLERLADLVQHRRRVVDLYHSILDSSPQLGQQGVAEGVVPSPWMYSVRLLGRSATERDSVIEHLAGVGIETRPVFPLVQSMPFVPERHRRPTPTAATISREGISLPTSTRLSTEQVRAVCSAFGRALGVHPFTR